MVNVVASRPRFWRTERRKTEHLVVWEWTGVSFAAFPFGKQLIDARLLGENRIAGTGLMNVLWFLFAGAWLAIGHLVAAVICIASCVAILPVFLGAPAWALAHLRLAGVSLAPLGKRVVSTAVAEEAYRRAARKNLDRAAA